MAVTRVDVCGRDTTHGYRFLGDAASRNYRRTVAIVGERMRSIGLKGDQLTVPGPTRQTLMVD